MERPSARAILPVETATPAEEFATPPRVLALDGEAARRAATRRIERFVAVRSLEPAAVVATRAEPTAAPRAEPAPAPPSAPPERSADVPPSPSRKGPESPRLERATASPAPPPPASAPHPSRVPLPESLLPAAGASAIEAAILAKARALPAAGSVELRFAIEPESLGNVRVRMEARGASLRVELSPSTPAGVDLLSASAGRLADSLRQAGFADAQVTVALDLPKDGRRDESAAERSPASSRAHKRVLASAPPPSRLGTGAEPRSLLDRTV